MTDTPAPLTAEELTMPKAWCCSDCRTKWEARLLAGLDAQARELATLKARFDDGTKFWKEQDAFYVKATLESARKNAEMEAELTRLRATLQLMADDGCSIDHWHGGRDCMELMARAAMEPKEAGL